jgi:hypothetical protein
VIAASVDGIDGDKSNSRIEMAGLSDTIQRIERAVGIMLTMDDVDVTWLGRIVADWKGGLPFDRAAGLADGWQRTWHQGQRNAALRELATRYFPDLRGSARARAMARAGRNYEATQWLKNKAARFRPDGKDGLLHDVATHGGMPGWELLRKSIR